MTPGGLRKQAPCSPGGPSPRQSPELRWPSLLLPSSAGASSLTHPSCARPPPASASLEPAAAAPSRGKNRAGTAASGASLFITLDLSCVHFRPFLLPAALCPKLTAEFKAVQINSSRNTNNKIQTQSPYAEKSALLHRI